MSQKANLIKTNFSAGEISPYMGGRVDVNRYANGAELIENFIVRPQGPVVRRMGTQFLGAVMNPDWNIRLVEFQTPTDDVYILEFGDFFMRVWKNHQLVMSGGSPLMLSTPYSHLELDKLSWSQSAAVLYLAHPNSLPYSVRFQNGVFSTAATPTEDGPYRATLPSDKDTTLKVTSYTHEALLSTTGNSFVPGDVGKYVEFWKDGVLMVGLIKTYYTAQNVLIEPKYNTIDMNKLDKTAVITFASSEVRSSKAIWSTETEYTFIKVGSSWYFMTTHQDLPQNVGTAPNSYSADVMRTTGSALAVVALVGNVSVYSESIRGYITSTNNLFTSSDVGRHIRLNLTSRSVWAHIVSVDSAKLVEVIFGNRIPSDPRDGTKLLQDGTTNIWKLGAWYDGNFPSIVTFHQNRLVYCATALEPNRFWLSESDDYKSFATTNIYNEVLDSSAINAGISSGLVNKIVWAQSGPVLLMGTLGEEVQVKASSIAEPLTPTNMQLSTQTSYGSLDNTRALKIGSSTIFIEQHGFRVREMVYSFEIDSFTASDTTVVSEHIFYKHVSARESTYQRVPSSLIWFRCDDGKLVTLTFEKDQQVYAWSNSSLGGNGQVLSICSTPYKDKKQDEVYMVVQREIDGNIVKYIEVLSPEFRPTSPTDLDGMIYLDCSKSYSGVATSTITGLTHLIGQTVSILANGAIHPDRVVDGAGQITLDYPATAVVVGYPYRSVIHTLPESTGSPFGTALGKNKKITRVDLQVLDTLGLKYGRTLDSLGYPVSFRETQGNMGEPPQLYSGFVELTDDSGYNKDGQFYIVQDQPYPCNILSVMPIIRVNE